MECVRPINLIEEWKTVDIPGVVPNYYQISNHGRLMNAKGQILKPIPIYNGYYAYALYTGKKNINEKYIRVFVHRLVLMYFNPIDNPEDFTADHWNTDKSDNNLLNLRWKTQAENNELSLAHYHKYGHNHYAAKFTDEDLIIIWNELKKGTKYADILVLIGKEVTDNNKDSIGNIKRGITYRRELENLRMRKLID